MADGGGFNFPPPQVSRLRAGEIVVDLFAGGGGASEALKQALGVDPHLAYNHDADAIGMHSANHPLTDHHREDIWHADPVRDVAGRPVGWFHASPDCFPAGTMVLTTQGYRPIEEIAVGDLVLTHSGRWRPVTHTMATERELMRITGHGHPGLTVSPEHPFFARQRRDVWSTDPRGYRAQYDPADWVRAGSLDKGWYWATPQTFPSCAVPAIGGRSMEITATLMWLVGRYLGDGWTRLDETHAELVITCGQHEAAGLAWLKDFWKSHSGRAGANELSWQERRTGTAHQFTTSHQGFVVWLREHFGHGAAEKKIPGWALGMRRDLRVALLEGYCSADGHHTASFIETQTVSKALAFGIKALATSLGHTVAVYTGSNRNRIEGRTVNVRPVWRCRWRHAVDPAHRQTFRDDLHEWAPIRKTAHGAGFGRVYNLSVAEDESYVVEGIVVHNCTHFSQAKGGQPRNHKIRSLSWVVLKWVGQLAKVGLAPRIVSLENVWQILKWGPLVAKRCRKTGRVIKMDGTVAAPGEHVRVEHQQLVPDPRHAGRTWRQFVHALETLGYVVEWRRLRACDYGAGTSRERLFLLARRDGEPIRWPEPTHGPGRPKPYVTAAECLNFTIACPSIFERKRPLADATMRRIARGVVRHVLEAEEPFFITEFANASNGRTWSGGEPLRTQCAGVKGGHFAAVVPTLVQTGYGERRGQAPRVPDIGAPLGTIVAGGVKHALASAALVKFRGESSGTPATEPVPTITSGAGAKRPAGAAHALGLMTAFLEQANGGGPNGNPARARSAREPVSAITASGSQQRLVTADLSALSPQAEAGALRVAAFLMRYHSTGGQWADCREPLTSVTTRDRLALVTVTIRGTPYVIVDIGLRMLRPPELYRATGFPPGYIHDRTADGRPLTITAQVRMCGNAVSPPPLCALANANLDPVHADMRQAA